jgi:predicted nucleic acid-binding protein
MKDNCKIELADEDQYNQAIVTFLKYDGKLSLADALSVEVMKKYDVAEIVSFDSNFDRVSGILRIKE